MPPDQIDAWALGFAIVIFVAAFVFICFGATRPRSSISQRSILRPEGASPRFFADSGIVAAGIQSNAELQEIADVQQGTSEPKRPLSYSSAEISTLKASSPERIRAYLDSKEYWNDIERHIWSIKDEDGVGLAGGYISYTERVLLLVLVGAIKKAKIGIYFSPAYFPEIPDADCTITAKVRADLAGAVRTIVSKFPELI